MIPDPGRVERCGAFRRCHIRSCCLVLTSDEGGRYVQVADAGGVGSFERQWNYDASYVHEMIDADPRAAWMFQRAASLGKYRKDVPVDALAAAASACK